MKRQHGFSEQRCSERPGLAPLEFVLCLPLLLMIMAMIIIAGTAGAWKVRTHANARQAAARALWPRDGNNDPKPASWWPASASMSAGTTGPAPFVADPFAQHEVVRGPQIASPNGGNALSVEQDLMDVSQEIFAGYSSIDRALPLWKQLPHRNKYHREVQVFSGDHWQFQQMGLSDTVRRRIPILYHDFDLGAGSGADPSRTSAAMQALLANPDRSTLLVLDRDDELRNFYGDPYVSNWYGRYDQFNFHPPAPDLCTLDLQPIVDSLTDRIEFAPRDLARAFCDFYSQQVCGSQNPDPQLQQAMQEIDQFLQSQYGERCECQ